MNAHAARSSRFAPVLVAGTLLACAPARDGVRDEAPAFGPSEADPAQEESWILAFVDSPAGGRASLPSLARGADGVLRLSWVERDDQGTGAHLYVAAFDGVGFDTPRHVASGTDWFVNWADFPTTAALADGTLLATWLQRNGEGAYTYGVRFARSLDDGATWSDPAWLHDDRSASEHGFVSVVPYDETRFLALWLDGRATAAAGGHGADAGHGHGGPMQIRARLVGRDGTLGPESLVDDRVCDCCQTTLARHADGTVLAAWRDRSETEVRDVHWATFDGSSWMRRGPVSEDAWEIPGCPVNGPRLAFADGRAACVWYTGAEPTGTYLAVGDAGSAFDPRVRIDDGASAGRVDVLALRDGGFLATWMEHHEEGVRWQARVVSAGGRALDTFPVAPTTSDRATGFLRAAPHEDGALLAWTDPARGTLRIARLTRGARPRP